MWSLILFDSHLLNHHNSCVDWADVWKNSNEHEQLVKELARIKSEGDGGEREESEEDKETFAASTWTQMKQVVKRGSVSLWRDTDYVTNKVALHIGSGLFNGFSFWMVSLPSSAQKHLIENRRGSL